MSVMMYMKHLIAFWEFYIGFVINAFLLAIFIIEKRKR